MDASSQPEASVTHNVQVPGVQISHSQDVPLGHQHQAFGSQISKDDVSLSHQKQDPSVQISQHHDSAAPPVQQKSEGSGRRHFFFPEDGLEMEYQTQLSCSMCNLVPSVQLFTYFITVSSC